MAILANAALKPPAHETAMVFCRVFLLFGEFRILLGSLRGSQRVAVPAGDVVPREFLVLVFPVRLSVTDGDLDQFRHRRFLLVLISHPCPEQDVAPKERGVFAVRHAGCGASTVGQYEEHAAQSGYPSVFFRFTRYRHPQRGFSVPRQKARTAREQGWKLSRFQTRRRDRALLCNIRRGRAYRTEVPNRQP